MAPDYAPAVHSNLGILAAQSGDWDEAIRRFEECLHIEPAHRQALMGLATTTLAAGRFDEAVVAHRRALGQNAGPEAVLRRGLGVAYLELGLLEDAERESLAALRLASEDVATMLTLARIYAERGEVESGERMCERALALAPGAPAVVSAVEALRVELHPGAEHDLPAGSDDLGGDDEPGASP
jgi:Flp pilus assembly protein TadD